MPKFSVTYEVITPESAEHGEADERGFEAENVSLREALRLAGGPFEASSSAPHRGMWFSSIDPDRDYGGGAETYRAIHPPRTITLSSLRRVARLLGVKP